MTLDIAACETAPDAAAALVGHLACDPDTVLARAWHIAPGDICDECPSRAQCPGRVPCLHLLASAGSPDRAAREESASGPSRFGRLPVGVRKIGLVAKTGRPLLVPEVRGDESWLVDPQWARQERVRAFAAHPLVANRDVLGVVALFLRRPASQDELAAMRRVADHAALRMAGARALERVRERERRTNIENLRLRMAALSDEGPFGLLGDSAAARRIREQVALVAPLGGAVLVTGEVGSGKTRVARAIHARSGLRGPLIRVDCREGLRAEEALFGNGAPDTRGIAASPGAASLAAGGTLVLEHVGALPGPVQDRVLGLLSEQPTVAADSIFEKVLPPARVVATSREDLRAAVEDGRFRPELYYPLSVLTVDVPPLRARIDDVAMLAEHFLRTSGEALALPAPLLQAEAAARLAAYDWPGNVRELQCAMERVVLAARGGPVPVEILPVASPAGPDAAGVPPVVPRAEWRRRERVNVEAALRRAGWRVSGKGGAADLLGMRPTTLASRMKALGVARPR